ncbi:MAG: S1 RNA-binding domain-containing protein, partial [Bacillota bacterium]
MPVELGSILEGTVTGITSFGAFVLLPDGVTGLVHISEVAEVYVRDINDFLKINDRVKVKVISVQDNGK